MVNDENIKSFIDYNYTPFSRGQCIKRLIVLWLASTVLCFIGKWSYLWVIPFGIINVLVSIVFIALVVKYDALKESRFLCDGVFYLYMAIVLNLASYRVIALQINAHWMLLFIFLFLLAVCVWVFVRITWLNIKSNKFSGADSRKKIIFLPLFGGVCGIVAGKLFLQGQSQQSVLAILSSVLLVLSFVLSIPSINLLKLMLCKKQQKKKE